MYGALLSSVLRRKARECRQVAETLQDKGIRDRLIVLAAEFEASALQRRRREIWVGKRPHTEGLTRSRDKLFKS